VNQLDDTQLDLASFAYADLTGGDKWDNSWAPTRTGWTDVGTPTVSGRFKIVGKQAFFQVKVVPATSIATTAGASYIPLPKAAKGLSGMATMSNSTTNIAVGLCHIDVANSRCYVPSQAASGNVFNLCGAYEI
jgi:hypothetical protein